MTEATNNEAQTEGRPRRRRPPARSQGSGERTVPLHKRVVSFFQTGDRKRGRDYVLEGRVQVQIDGSRARAKVRGNDQPSYPVGLDWSQVDSDRVLHTYCGCQRFAQGRPCKHLWATLLALSESAPESQPVGGDRLKLRKDPTTSWQDLGIPANGGEGANQRDSPKRRSKRRRQRSRSSRRRATSPGAAWQSQLNSLRDQVEKKSGAQHRGRSQLVPHFLLNTKASEAQGGLVLDVFGRGADSTKLKRTSLDPAELEALLAPTPRDSEDEEDSPAVVTALPPDRGRPNRGGRRKPPAKGVQRFRLPARLYDAVLPHLCAQGNLGSWDGRAIGNSTTLSWDGEEPWRLVLKLAIAGRTVRLSGALQRNGESQTLSEPLMILPAERSDNGAGVVLFPESLARLETRRDIDASWIAALREAGEIVVPREDLEEALSSLLDIPGLPPLDAPEELSISEDTSPPQPRLVLEPDPASAHPDPQLLVQLSFLYGSAEVSAGDPRPAIVDWDTGNFVRREMECEHKALVRLLELGPQPLESSQGHLLELNPRDLSAVAEPLLLEGWDVEVRGTSLRPPSPPSLRVESGVDWFELSGGVDFDGDLVDLKKVLEAVERGEHFVELEDGSRGLLPASWMETYDSLSQLAHSSSDEGLRFLPSQALLVDALLTAMPPAQVDNEFAQLREKLTSFERIKPKKEPRGFEGTLRGYQREGLGWLEFLREYGLGGVLADDMGLGKTVQVLALMRKHRMPSTSTGLPFLVVAPRSLVFNWLDEAQRFVPKLKVVQYLGSEREELREEIGDYDVVVTTYGTLRRDVGYLATVDFDTVILDEAQAIKNPESQTAKASRVLQARNRLALTGTPIENHLGELGSIFEFLNPGLLGRLPKLDVLASGGAPSKSELELVATGLRPFILRRTKAQVLKDLPPKTEQVLICDLTDRQRELYDQLKATYQASLLQQVESEGVSGSALQVLEALLRLRQVACHPGLVDTDWADAGSAKLEALFEQVSEVLDEGHKVIVFSQFTKLLAYVRQELDEREVTYAYLDGQTRNRGEVVERFQNDPDTNLFLISLKAGGLGLNLTAAGYVFLLDPWWNPAVEAQAIDRAHRIGQTQPVFAYRMIARDTVEEKILELQRSKKRLAEVVLEGEGQSLKDLTADDLRTLLS